MYEPEETLSTSMVPPWEVIWWVAVSWLEDDGRTAEVSASALKYSHIYVRIAVMIFCGYICVYACAWECIYIWYISCISFSQVRECV